MNIGFTGTQDGMTSEQVVSFQAALSELGASCLRHGDCVGAMRKSAVARMFSVTQSYVGLLVKERS